MPSSSIGIVDGPFSEETLVCQFVNHVMNAQGSTWFHKNPLNFIFPTALLQLIVISTITSAIWLLLKPFKQGLITAQLICGIIMGRSFLGRIEGYNEVLFPPGGRVILETLAELGFMFYLFVLGVHVDLSMVKKIGRHAIAIGTCCYFIPMVIGVATSVLMVQVVDVDLTTKKTLMFVATVNAQSSFAVITSLLADLKILNSDIGRTAAMASFVSDVCSYFTSIFTGVVAISVNTSTHMAALLALGACSFLLITLFVFRPIIASVARRVPSGGSLNEIQFLTIVLLVALCGLSAQLLGQPGPLGTFILGVALPDGPPLGSSLVNKIDMILVGLFFPVKFVLTGLGLDIFCVGGVSGALIAFVILISYTTKFLGTLLPALYYKATLKDAVTLSLIMCCRGVIEAVLYINMLQKGVINQQEQVFLFISMLVVTGIARPLISYLYDPSAKYIGIHHNTIMNNHPNDELRMLVCVHNEANVPALLNLLDASTPTRSKPMAIFVLNLMELKGRAAAVLESTTVQKKQFNTTSSRSWPKKVANAFNQFVNLYQGSISCRHFTSIAPYDSMHNDICTLALEQNVNIAIFPFHKTIDGGGEGTNSSRIRLVNQNLLEKSPCSVGILIDRGLVPSNRLLLRDHLSMLRVYVLFIGGADDCEALAYSTRFIDNPQVSLTFVWIRPLDQEKYEELTEESIETQMVNQLRDRAIGNKRVSYKEELVSNAIGTTKVIKSIEGRCDLCVVGRYHDPNSQLLLGLNDWSEYPELGIIGDWLANSDVKFSVLVVQQQPPATNNRSLQPISSSTSHNSC